MSHPGGFTYAIGKLGQAIEELVGVGDIKQRLEIASLTLAPIVPGDFPEGHLRDEYASIREALTWVPPEEESEQGLLGATIDEMTEAEAGVLAQRLLTLYLDAEVTFRGSL